MPGGPTLAYADTGGDGPAVVFSHGLLMDKTMFDLQVAALRDRFRCVTWDERAHGETQWSGAFNYWDSARDLLALLDHLGIDRAVLVGMSQGGFLSLRAALLAPARVAGLVMLDSQAGPEPAQLAPFYEELASDWEANGPNEQTLAYIASVILGDGVDAGEWLARWRARPPDQAREMTAALVGREDLTDRLVEVSAPVLVIHGTADTAIPLARAVAVAEGVPDCRGLLVINGAPHAANLSHPDEVNAALREFLDQV